MDLSNLKPKAVHFKIRVQGKKLALTMRPFTLRDLSYFQDNFEQADFAIKLMKGHLDTVAQVIWYQLDTPSKQAIEALNIVDETGQKIEDHIQLLAVFEPADICRALAAFSECRGLNAPQIEETLKNIDVKKKS